MDEPAVLGLKEIRLIRGAFGNPLRIADKAVRVIPDWPYRSCPIIVWASRQTLAIRMPTEFKTASWSHTRWLKLGVIAAVAAILLVMWALVLLSNGNARRAALASAGRDAENLSAAFADEVNRTMDDLAGAMSIVAEKVAAKNGDFNIYDIRDQITRMSHGVIQAGIIGPDGHLRSTTVDPHPAPIDLSDREHFRVQLDGSAHGLFIGKPVTGRISHQITIMLSQRIEDKNGRLLGVLAFGVAPASLTSLPQMIDLGRHGMIGLVGFDNVVRAHFSDTSPNGLENVGRTITVHPTPIEAANSDKSVIREDRVEHVTRIFGNRRVSGYPLVVGVGLDLDDALAPVEAHARATDFLAGLATLGLILLVLYLLCEIDRRTARERALAEEHQKLERANTDLATSKRLAEEAETRLTDAIECISEPFVIYDKDDRLVQCNQAYRQAFPHPRISDIRGMKFEDLIADSLAHGTFKASAEEKDPWVARRTDVHRQAPATMQIALSNGRHLLATDSRMKSGGFAGLRVDITDLVRTKEALEQLARTDQVTDLPNRRAFTEALQQALDRVSRGEKIFAVHYLDLDHFKDINDTLGHQAGDELLVAVGKRLRSSVRSTDVVARIGGDEFAVLQRDIRNPADAVVLAEKLLEAIAQPFSLGGNQVQIGTSIGITASDAETASIEAFLSHADLALYRAKADGRGTYRFFADTMDKEVHTRVKLVNELRQAIAMGQLVLHYQPQIDVRDGKIVGLEALVRWNHPTRGLLTPAHFISIAETNGLIVPLGRWVLNEVCRQMKEWLDAGIAPPLLAINLSAADFKLTGIGHQILEVMEKYSLPAGCIELEITEYTAMELSQRTDDVVDFLRWNGLRISIDDFGTGYSSLAYLKRLRPHRIKIAREFIFNLLDNEADRAVVQSVIDIAHALDIDLIAEGVEQAAQAKFLCDHGCYHAQGFAFSRALPADEVAALLQRKQVFTLINSATIPAVA